MKSKIEKRSQNHVLQEMTEQIKDSAYKTIDEKQIINELNQQQELKTIKINIHGQQLSLNKNNEIFYESEFEYDYESETEKYLQQLIILINRREELDEYPLEKLAKNQLEELKPCSLQEAIGYLKKSKRKHKYKWLNQDENKTYNKRLKILQSIYQKIADRNQPLYYSATNRNTRDEQAVEFVTTQESLDNGTQNLAQLSSGLVSLFSGAFAEPQDIHNLPDYEFIDMIKLIKFGDWLKIKQWNNGYEELLSTAFDVQWLSFDFDHSYQGKWYGAFLHDNKICLLNGYFGSCSGCDGLMESDPLEWIKDHLKNVRAFKNYEDAITWLRKTNDYSYRRDWEATTRLIQKLILLKHRFENNTESKSV